MPVESLGVCLVLKGKRALNYSPTASIAVSWAELQVSALGSDSTRFAAGSQLYVHRLHGVDFLAYRPKSLCSLASPAMRPRRQSVNKLLRL